MNVRILPFGNVPSQTRLLSHKYRVTRSADGEPPPGSVAQPPLVFVGRPKKGSLLLLQAGPGQSGVKRECLYKILVIGELGTGKTSIIKRYVHQFFSQHYRATIGVDFALKVVHWDQSTVIRLQLWDIAGKKNRNNPIIHVFSSNQMK